MDMSQRGIAEGDFASAISLYHAYELLLQHGLRTFFKFVCKVTGEGGEPQAGPGGANTPTFGINRLRSFLLFQFVLRKVSAEAVFLVVCDPSMNEL
jgi:hypothetical protein